ncbi:uncharacterized mitochondrial protein-like protein [Tanacetum coccineum]
MMPIWKDSSYFNSPTKNVDNGEPKTADDAQKQDKDGLNNENAEQERFSDDSCSKDVNVVRQQVDTASPDVNTSSPELNVVGPSVSTASPNEEDNTEEEPEVSIIGIRQSKQSLQGGQGTLWVESSTKSMVYVDDIIFGSTNKELCTRFEKLIKDKFQMSSMGELTFFLGLQVQQKQDGIFISQDKYVDEILKKFSYTNVKSDSTPVDLEKPFVKDGDANDVDVHLYRSMIGSLMYLTTSRPDIIYLKGKPTLGLWYSRDSPFELVAYSDSDYAGATQDRKSTTRGCQFLGNSQSMDGRICNIKSVLKRIKKTSRHVKRGRDTKIPQSSGPPIKVGDETVHKELDDRMERAATTASSLEAKRDSAKANTINGERQLQALVDKKRVIITESSIRSDLHLADAGGIDCLPTAIIFEELARMGAKSTAWNEFSSTMDSTIICLATNQKLNLSKYIFDAMIPIIAQPSSSRPQKKQSRRKQRKETKVLDLEKAKDAQAKEIVGLKKRMIYGDEVIVDMAVGEKQEKSAKIDEREKKRNGEEKEEEANIALIESWENTQAMMEADRLLAERLQTREHGVN